MLQLLAVALGGAVGSLTRYGVGIATLRWLPLNFPYATLLVNVFGSLVMGFAMVWFSSGEGHSPLLRLLLTVGFCGGFTTFSTFSMDNVYLLQTHHYGMATLNILMNVVLCLLAVGLGILIANKV